MVKSLQCFLYVAVPMLLIVGCYGSSIAPNTLSTLKMQKFIQSSCKSTTYPQACISMLAPYAGYLKAEKASELAKVAVKVSLTNCRNINIWSRRQYTLKMSSREKAALKDCVDNFGDSTDQIKQSLALLKHLRASSFRMQMSDIQTYMSAALTNQDSCLDGFQTASGNSQVKVLMQAKIKKLTAITSNALALINRCAASGGYGL